MQPSFAARFYRARPILVALACASPLLLLGGLWWAVNAFLLTPGVPGDDAPAEECVGFIVHEKGLPRLAGDRRDRFLDHHLQRLIRDEQLRRRFAEALRRLTPEEQAAFHGHLVDAFKPRVLADVQRFHDLHGEPRRHYVDERIVEYNRVGALLRSGRIDRSAFGNALPDSAQIAELLLTRTSEKEQQLGLAYLTALAERIKQILADPELKREFEARIAAAHTP
jgi:hypothetical protein